MVVDLLKKGWNDNDISKELGMTLEEVLRLKQQTGIAELFKDRFHSKSWIVENN